MSASLVGSEMCIRDSSGVRAISFDHVGLSDRICLEGFRALFRMVRCLLYTSDAADDMQCVEL
eukprot:10507039-Alexandrium_andersonii.AAC.1